ncbi:MAG: phage minor head protein [Pseudomonadota bacterium]
MNDAEYERLLSQFEEEIYQALKAAVELTRAEFDTQQLAEAIASGNQEAITLGLDIATDTLAANLDTALAAVFGPAFAIVGITAATALGQPRFTPPTSATVIRDNLRYRITRDFTSAMRQAMGVTVDSMLGRGDSPRLIAGFVGRNIGLSFNQQRSLDAFRAVLVDGLRTGNTTLPANRIRNLSASQRSVLRANLANGISEDDIDRLTNRQRRIMFEHRANTTARTEAVRLVNAAQQTAWEELDRQGQINGYRRFWRDARDERVRVTHRAISRLNPVGRGLHEPFQTPLGPVHLPPIEVNCRCRIVLAMPR